MEAAEHDGIDDFGFKKNQEFQKFKSIKINFKDSLLLYLSNWFGMCYSKKCWNKKTKLQKLIDVGSDKMESELNVINIMNDLRNLKIMLKSTFMTKEVKRKIKLTGKNVIDLDTSSDESNDDQLEDKANIDQANSNPSKDLTQMVNENLELEIVSRSRNIAKSRAR